MVSGPISSWEIDGETVETIPQREVLALVNGVDLHVHAVVLHRVSCHGRTESIIQERTTARPRIWKEPASATRAPFEHVRMYAAGDYTQV